MEWYPLAWLKLEAPNIFICNNSLKLINFLLQKALLLLVFIYF